MIDRPPEVLIKCPHLVTIQLGQQFSCSMCGAVWGGRAIPLPGESPSWDARIVKALAYEERKAKRRAFWRRIWNHVTSQQ